MLDAGVVRCSTYTSPCFRLSYPFFSHVVLAITLVDGSIGPVHPLNGICGRRMFAGINVQICKGREPDTLYKFVYLQKHPHLSQHPLAGHQPVLTGFSMKRSSVDYSGQ